VRATPVDRYDRGLGPGRDSHAQTDGRPRGSGPVLPGTHRFLEEPDPQAVFAAGAAADNGARVAAMCVGAFTLAAAGLLDGRRATTPCQWAGELARRYPDIDVDPGVLFVDQGPDPPTRRPRPGGTHRAAGGDTRVARRRHSWRIHSEGLAPQNYSGSIRHSDENGWLTPAPWTVVAGVESCQVLEADVTRARRAVWHRAGRRYDS
jgi:hypothetical protein